MKDDIDVTILNIIQNNSRTSNAEIARRLKMAPPAILERIRRLEERDRVMGYEARLNSRAIEPGLLVSVFVRTNEIVIW